MSYLQWIVLIACSVAVAWFTNNPVPLGIGFALGITLLVCAFSTRGLKAPVQSFRKVEHQLLSAGQSTKVTVQASSGASSWFRWLLLTDSIPAKAVADAPTGCMSFGQVPEIRFTYGVTFPYRGVYEVGPIKSTFCDVLGFKSQEIAGTDRVEVTVHPRVFPMHEFALPSLRSFGELPSRQNRVEDPTRNSGVRAYQNGDPLKRIHWQATAKSGNLLSRLYDGSTTPVVVVIVNQNVSDFVDSDTFELACTVAASCLSNAQFADFEFTVAEGTHDGRPLLGAECNELQLENCLSVLARLSLENRPFYHRLLELTPLLPWRSSLLIVTQELDADSAGVLDLLAKGGSTISAVLVGPASADSELRIATLGGMAAKAAREEEIANIHFVRY